MVDGLFIALLAVFVIFKPNTLWIAAALALHYWLVRGARCFLVDPPWRKHGHGYAFWSPSTS